MSGTVDRARAGIGPPPVEAGVQSIGVVLRGGRWAVVREPGSAARSLHDRKADAVEAARRLAACEGARVVVFGLDGRPQDPGEESARIWR